MTDASGQQTEVAMPIEGDTEDESRATPEAVLAFDRMTKEQLKDSVQERVLHFFTKKGQAIDDVDVRPPAAAAPLLLHLTPPGVAAYRSCCKPRQSSSKRR